MLDASSTFFYRMISFMLILIFKIYIARILTVEDNGLFGKWLVSINYGSIVLGLGLNLALIYYVKSNVVDISNAFYNNLRVYFYIATILIFLSTLFFNSFYNISLIVSIFLILLIGSVNSIQLASNHIKLYNLSEVFKNILILSATILLVSFYNLTLDYLYIVYIACLFITFLIFFKKTGIKLISKVKLKKVNLDYYKYGLKGTVLNSLGQSMYVIDIFIVDYLVGPYYLGLYVVASSVSRMLWIFVDAAGTIIYPKLVSDQTLAKSKDRIYRLSTLSFSINILVVLIFYCIGEFLLLITFGKEYIDAFLAILILMLGSSGMMLYKLINRYLAANNNWMLCYIVLSISIIVNVVLNFYLIGIYNILGAALSSLISYWVCGLLIAYFAKLNLLSLFFYRNILKQ